MGALVYIPRRLQLTWPPTVSWSPTKVVVSCVLPTQGHVSSDGPTAAMQTDVLLLQVRNCGTVFQLIWDKPTLNINGLSGCQNIFIRVLTMRWLWLAVIVRALLAYLLTYLHVSSSDSVVYSVEEARSSPMCVHMCVYVCALAYAKLWLRTWRGVWLILWGRSKLWGQKHVPTVFGLRLVWDK